MRTLEQLLTVPALLLLGACATTSTKLAPVDRERVRAEEQYQRRLVIRDGRSEQQRLDAVAFPILTGGKDLCRGDTTWLWGFRWDAASSYDGDWQTAARAEGLSDTLAVVSVAPGSPADVAGLRAGDHLLRIDGHGLPEGKKGSKAASSALADAREGQGRIHVEAERDGAPLDLHMEGVRGCRYGHVVTAQGGINAYADGDDVIVPLAMMRFVQDDELQVVVAHEIAHNAMGHVGARKRNSVLGGILGAMGDMVLAAAGIDSGGLFMDKGFAAGAQAFSQDFEREADYVGMYLLARAGAPLANAPNLWRHFAQLDPSSIAFASTHPTTAERFVRLREITAEIEAKEASGQPLVPEPSNDR